LFYDHLDNIYQIPVVATDCVNINTYNHGKYTNVARGGVFQAMVGPDAFTDGTLPTQNDALYEGASGLITTVAGTYRIGRCNALVAVQHRSGEYNVAHCEFDFDF
jgi:hypothetical protein